MSTSEVLTAYLQGLSDVELAEVLLAGITRTELRERLSADDAATLFNTTYLSTLGWQFVITPLPNHLFTRDTSAWLYGGRSVNTMALAPRRREAVNYEAVYRYHPAFADRGLLWSEPHGASPATVEGGDFQVLGNRALVMGLSHRSSAAGVERLATWTDLKQHGVLVFQNCGDVFTEAHRPANVSRPVIGAGGVFLRKP